MAVSDWRLAGAAVLVLLLAGCAGKKPARIQEGANVTFSNCRITNRTPDGKALSCECLNVQLVLDAKTGRYKVVCGGKTAEPQRR